LSDVESLYELPTVAGLMGYCYNWRGIQLMSIPSKFLTRIILERLKTVVNNTLRDEQAGFRAGRSCIDQIATLRIKLVLY